jgi:hypothetical protein
VSEEWGEREFFAVGAGLERVADFREFCKLGLDDLACDVRIERFDRCDGATDDSLGALP